MNKLHCLAINPQWHDEYFLSLPLGLATIAAITESIGHCIRVVDFDAERIPDSQKQSYLAQLGCVPDLVLLTGMITNFIRLRALAKLVKNIWPQTIVILGGSLATTAPDPILRELDVDIFVIGEGDDTIKSLLTALATKSVLEKVKVIKFKADNNAISFTSMSPSPDITKTPRPAYGLFPMHAYTDFYKKSGRSFEMYASKGCSNSCVYCFRMSGRKVRYRLVDEVISEIKFVKEIYGIERFSFEDDNFGTNKKWLYEFCEKVSPLAIQFRFQASVNAFAIDMLDRLQEAGLFGVSIGMESGSPLILKEMDKNIDLSKAERLFAALRSRHISYNATFVIGMPGETDDTIEMTKEFLICNGFTTNYQLFFITPYPGTKLFQYAVDKGAIKDQSEYIKNLKLQDDININLTSYQDKKLTEWKEYILREVSAQSLHNGLTTFRGATWKKEAIQ